mgnify:FL=1|tara:strand:+ start:3947 stop:4975 length:1029 start_codon:yes stop_codon:yes gene_type:complete
MANLTPTNFKTAQSKMMGKFASNEMRLISANTYLEISKLTQFMLPNYLELRKREDRAIETSLLTRSKRSVLTARSSTHTGNRGDSAIVTPTWSTSADVFSLSLKQYDNNQYSMQEGLDNLYENAYLNMVESLEDDAQNYLFGEKTGVNISTGGGGTFNATDDVYNFAAVNVNTIIQKTKTVMEENGYKGAITIFADSIAYDLFKFQAFQGAGNDVNLSFQFEGITFVRSIGYAAKFLPLAGTYATGVWTAVANDSIGAMPWIPKQNREGVATRLQTYSSAISPYDGTPYAVHYYETASDQSGSNGMTQDEVTQVEISQDMSFMSSPITVTDETSLFAFSLQA